MAPIVGSLGAQVVAEPARDARELAGEERRRPARLLGPLANDHRLTEHPRAKGSERLRRKRPRRRTVADDRKARGPVARGAARRERRQDPAAEDRRSDAVAAVPEAVV